MFETICDKTQMVLIWVEMKKILLITTGGTIASIQKEKGLVPGIDGNNLVIKSPCFNNLLIIHSPIYGKYSIK